MKEYIKYLENYVDKQNLEIIDLHNKINEYKRQVMYLRNDEVTNEKIIDNYKEKLYWIEKWIVKVQNDNSRLEPIINTDELDEILEIIKRGV